MALGNVARRDSVAYVISLMKAQSGEHADDFPVIDINCYQHVANATDALFHWLAAIESVNQQMTKSGDEDPVFIGGGDIGDEVR